MCCTCPASSRSSSFSCFSRVISPSLRSISLCNCKRMHRLVLKHCFVPSVTYSLQGRGSIVKVLTFVQFIRNKSLVHWPPFHCSGYISRGEEAAKWPIAQHLTCSCKHSLISKTDLIKDRPKTSSTQKNKQKTEFNITRNQSHWMQAITFSFSCKAS